MVVTINVRHVYKYPMEFVADAHFTKYPSKKEKFVKCLDVVEQKKDLVKGVNYRRSIAVCDNVIPSILRKLHVLDEKAILLEEKAWLDLQKRRLVLESRNITWANYADMTEKSLFTSDTTNPRWTVFEQHGRINIIGLGPFGRVIEMFAERFLNAGVKRSLDIMEDLLHQRYSNRVPEQR